MRFPACHVVILALACFAGGLMGMARAGEESEPRFSSTLSPVQQAETGLDRLTVDNIAVIDALVRLDASSATRLVRNNIRTTRFSARRTAHERDIAGLDRLTPEQLRKLDQFVALRIPAPVPADADLAYASVRLDSTTPIAIKKPAPEIHGSVSLTYGWNRGGSIRGVDTSVTYIDPHKRYAITVGYSDYRGNGLASYPLYPYAAPYLSPYSALNRYPPSYRPPSPVLSVDDED
jgi:hypothetical protein